MALKLHLSCALEREALAGIADTTRANVAAWAAGAPVNVVKA